jgi:hypothetical protein
MKVTELRKKLLDEGCNPHNFAVLSTTHDAFCIDKDGNQWKVFYSERGQNSDPIFTSTDESEACDFFYDLILKQQHWHLVGFFKNEADAKALEEKLLAADIKPVRNDFPSYKTANDPRYRVFVVGKDIFKAKELLGKIDIKFE